MILVTGFGPYKEDLNASGVLVKSLSDELPADLAALAGELTFEILACDNTSREIGHLGLEIQLSNLLERYEPDICIHTGQAPAYNRITIEKIAINSFMREVIDPHRPVGYWSTLPGTDDLKTRLENEDIPAACSFYAGQHLCNHILYSSLYFSNKNDTRHKAGFIHVPLLPRQAISEHKDSPFMEPEMTRKALSIIIQSVAAA